MIKEAFPNFGVWWEQALWSLQQAEYGGKEAFTRLQQGQKAQAQEAWKLCGEKLAALSQHLQAHPSALQPHSRLSRLLERMATQRQAWENFNNDSLLGSSLWECLIDYLAWFRLLRRTRQVLESLWAEQWTSPLARWKKRLCQILLGAGFMGASLALIFYLSFPYQAPGMLILEAPEPWGRSFPDATLDFQRPHLSFHARADDQFQQITIPLEQIPDQGFLTLALELRWGRVWELEWVRLLGENGQVLRVFDLKQESHQWYIGNSLQLPIYEVTEERLQLLRELQQHPAYRERWLQERGFPTEALAQSLQWEAQWSKLLGKVFSSKAAFHRQLEQWGRTSATERTLLKQIFRKPLYAPRSWGLLPVLVSPLVAEKGVTAVQLRLCIHSWLNQSGGCEAPPGIE